jgi:hypothetical protein
MLIGMIVSFALFAKYEVKIDEEPYRIIPTRKSVPLQLNYQGLLCRESDTVGVTDTLSMIFRLYTQETGGTPVWDETHTAVPVDKGIFNVLLSITADIFTGAPLWLEVQVETDTLTPRKKLVSVGYAIRAQTADSAITAGNSYRIEGNTLSSLDARWVNEGQANAITPGMLQDGAVISNKIAPNAVNTGKILNSTITREDLSGELQRDLDTADYALSANITNVDSANVSANSYQWNGNTWGTEVPQANNADTAVYANNADQLDGQDASAFAQASHTHTRVDSATYADTAAYTVQSATDNDWQITDTVLWTSDYRGIARGGAGNEMYGDSVHTHINLGVNCITGTSGQNYYYCTISGGRNNRATANSATVGGGYQNKADSAYATIPGGRFVIVRGRGSFGFG